MNSRDPVTLSTGQPIPDIQSLVDTRKLPIQAVGVRSVKYPVLIQLEGQRVLPSVAEFEMTVYLPAEQKGTHMSRFIALLEEMQDQVITLQAFRALVESMLVKLDAHSGQIQMKLPYFLKKQAPISGVSSLLDYELELNGKVDEAGQMALWVTVVVPVTSLCPCSKKISDYGAHNQRSNVTAKVLVHGDLEVSELIRAIEKQASCELYGLLKRPDEKYVTERAYDNPKFVEDMVRDVALALDQFKQVKSYVVEAENFESIHNHSAYAKILK